MGWRPRVRRASAAEVILHFAGRLQVDLVLFRSVHALRAPLMRALLGTCRISALAECAGRAAGAPLRRPASERALCVLFDGLGPPGKRRSIDNSSMHRRGRLHSTACGATHASKTVPTPKALCLSAPPAPNIGQRPPECPRGGALITSPSEIRRPPARAVYQGRAALFASPILCRPLPSSAGSVPVPGRAWTRQRGRP